MPTEVERPARRRHFLFPENKARTMSKLTIKTLILLRIGNNLQHIHSSLRLESALLPLINHDLLQNLPEIQLHPHPPLIAEIVKTKASWKLPSSSFVNVNVVVSRAQAKASMPASYIQNHITISNIYF